MDRHFNAFYAYRHGNYRDTERERILEDNVTRALMIVLKSSCVLTREFSHEVRGYRYLLALTSTIFRASWKVRTLGSRIAGVFLGSG